MSKHSQLFFAETAGELAERAAARIIDLATEALQQRGCFAVALGGGRTPRALFTTLVGRFRDAIDWSRVIFLWGDERSVPPDHAESNYGMAQELLLEPLGIPQANRLRMEGERTDLNAAATDYEQSIRERLPSNSQLTPVLDLVLLGMGADAHTASLFPNSPALQENERLVVANHVSSLGAHRLTMTFRLINAARRVMFIIAGASKADALASVLEGSRNVGLYPSQGVRGEAVEWWIDAEAGALLQSRQ